MTVNHVKLRTQTKAAKLGLVRCVLDSKMGCIIAETKPGRVFVLPEENGEKVFTNRLRSLSWERMFELLDSCQIAEASHESS